MIEDNNGNLADPPIHEAFELSYASFLVIPRLLLEAMPWGWQTEMVDLMEEFNKKYKNWIPDGKEIMVRMIGEDGRYVKLPENICNYRRGDAKEFEKPSGESG